MSSHLLALRTEVCHAAGCKNLAIFIVHLGPGHDEKLCEEHKVARVTPIMMGMYEQDEEFRDLVQANKIDYFSGENLPQYPRWRPI